MKDTQKKKSGIGIIYILMIFSFFIYNPVQGQLRKYANEFLYIGAGAAMSGMGNAGVAHVSDATSGYWNPAALIEMKGKFQLSLMHSPYFSGLANYDYISFSRKSDENNAFGVSVIRMGVDNIPNTLDLKDPGGQINYNRIKTFSVADYAVLLSYSRKINDNNSLGGNIKIIRRKIGDFANGWGFGVDLGWKKTFNDWNFAICGKDITFTFTGWKMTLTEEEKLKLTQAGNEIPSSSLEVASPRITSGISRFIKFNENMGMHSNFDLVLTLDGKRNTLIKTNGFSLGPLIGTEFDYKKTAFLRFGFSNFQKQKTLDQKNYITVQPNIGIGVKLKAISLDYAFTDPGNLSAALYSHIFSLRFTINEENSE